MGLIYFYLLENMQIFYKKMGVRLIAEIYLLVPLKL